jgi:ATP-dependent 26S proteasome regulatory subunit
MKKSKKVSNQPAATALQNKPSIIEIDDVDDLKTERLNKTQPMADLK